MRTSLFTRLAIVCVTALLGVALPGCETYQVAPSDEWRAVAGAIDQHEASLGERVARMAHIQIDDTGTRARAVYEIVWRPGHGAGVGENRRTDVRTGLERREGGWVVVERTSAADRHSFD